MIRIFVLLTGFLIYSSAVLSQEPGFKAVSNEESFKVMYKNAVEKIQSINSSFTQEKNISLIDEKIISKGEFYFKRPNLVRMEYTSPYQYLLIINNDNILIKDVQKQSTYSVRNNKLLNKINKTIIDSVQGTILLNNDFKGKILENENRYLIYLVPLVKEMNELFSAVKIYIDKKDLSVYQINLMEQSGDNTLITFQNKQINKEISDALFSIN